MYANNFFLCGLVAFAASQTIPALGNVGRIHGLGLGHSLVPDHSSWAALEALRNNEDAKISANPLNHGLWGTQNWIAGGLWGSNAINHHGFGQSAIGDAEDQANVQELLNLMVTNPNIAAKIATLNVRQRQVIANVARAINNVVARKGPLATAALWNGVLTGNSLVVNTISSHSFGMEQQILSTLTHVATIDPQLVHNLLSLNPVKRSIVADLSTRINGETLKKGPAYPIAIWQQAKKVQGGVTSWSNIHRL